MSEPESRNKTNDYSYFTVGVLLVLIGIRFFSTGTVSTQHRLVTATCFLFGVVILVTAPRYMWRFSALCTAMLFFGGILILYGTFVFITGESGGGASQHVSHLSGFRSIGTGAIIAMIGFVLRTIHSMFHE